MVTGFCLRMNLLVYSILYGTTRSLTLDRGWSIKDSRSFEGLSEVPVSNNTSTTHFKESTRSSLAHPCRITIQRAAEQQFQLIRIQTIMMRGRIMRAPAVNLVGTYAAADQLPTAITRPNSQATWPPGSEEQQ